MRIKGYVVSACVALAATGFARLAPAQVQQLRHWSGQNVSPAFEGWEPNPDGTFTLWFGYMNRNYEEEPDVPLGPDNRFEPGGDLGQPTHFAIRRHKDVFGVVVPKDFGNKTLVWTLTVHGKTETAPGTLLPTAQIDRRRTTRGGTSDNVSSNLPPAVTAQPESATATVGKSVAIKVSATDDGLPKRNGKSIGMNAQWTKYRGPGTVTFEPDRSDLVEGATSTAASFSQPGDYVLQVTVDDGSGENAGNFGYHCCWTSAQVKVTVR
jgi:hypothetical protein